MRENIEFPIRINRYLELKGLTTRRGADDLIKQGLVLVNNKKTVLGYKVTTNDKVEVKSDDKTIQGKYIYLAFNKPRGLATEEIKISLPTFPTTVIGNIFPLGRLDKDSEGLILLTNDGRITDRLLNPKYEHEKVYEVEVREKVSPMIKKILEGGIIVRIKHKNYNLKAKAVKILDSHNLTITLTEGKKHEIRQMLDGAHTTVVCLKRVQIMNIKLGNLAPNQSRPLTPKELKEFLAMLY